MPTSGAGRSCLSPHPPLRLTDMECSFLSSLVNSSAVPLRSRRSSDHGVSVRHLGFLASYNQAVLGMEPGLFLWAQADSRRSSSFGFPYVSGALVVPRRVRLFQACRHRITAWSPGHEGSFSGGVLPLRVACQSPERRISSQARSQARQVPVVSWSRRLRDFWLPTDPSSFPKSPC